MGSGNGKLKVTWIYIALSRKNPKALRYGSYSFICKQHYACLHLVRVHQMAPPLIMVTDILQLITHLSNNLAFGK